jgi:hypothetical protein
MRLTSEPPAPPAVAIVVAGHGHGPLKALLAPLIFNFDALLGTVSGDVGRCLPVAARRHLTTSPCWVKHDRLIASGALGGVTLPWDLCVAPRWCARATVVNWPGCGLTPRWCV